MKTVKFLFENDERVNTPLCDNCIITSMCLNQNNEIIYYIENNKQGVANEWWPERLVTLT
jgi:hypothetical protein